MSTAIKTVQDKQQLLTQAAYFEYQAIVREVTTEMLRDWLMETHGMKKAKAADFAQQLAFRLRWRKHAPFCLGFWDRRFEDLPWDYATYQHIQYTVLMNEFVIHQASRMVNDPTKVHVYRLGYHPTEFSRELTDDETLTDWLVANSVKQQYVADLVEELGHRWTEMLNFYRYRVKDKHRAEGQNSLWYRRFVEDYGNDATWNQPRYRWEPLRRDHPWFIDFEGSIAAVPR